jgi:hypothetical protein
MMLGNNPKTFKQDNNHGESLQSHMIPWSYLSSLLPSVSH